MRFAMIGLMIVLLEACSLAQTTQPATVPSTQPVLMPRNDLPGLKNFARVSDSLWRGQQPSAEGFKTLKQMGVKTIVNLRSFNSDRDELTGLGLQYVHIYCKAWHPEDEDVVQFLKVLENPANHPIFVHCQAGSDRTGTMVAVYRMLIENWSIEDAMTELPRFGFHEIWTEIRVYLKHFDVAKMKKVLDEAPAVKVETVK